MFFLEESELSVVSDMDKPKLSDRLVKEGLITPMMLEQLKREWMKSVKKLNDDDED